MKNQGALRNRRAYKIAHLLGLEPSAFAARLSEEQIEYINYRASKLCYLEACPGSGKTEVIGVKAAYEIARWNSLFSGIAVLTFTKSAASELSNRITVFAKGKSLKHPHYVGTFDSWLHRYILHPFSHRHVGYVGKNGDKSIRVISNEEDGVFLSSFNYSVYRNGKAEGRIKVNDFYLDHANGEIVGNSERFRVDLTTQEISILKINKLAFLRAGLSTYQDAETTCFQILNSWRGFAKKIVERFPILIIDECQDLSDTQLAMLQALIREGCSVHLIGDLNQSVYEFRKVDPIHVEQFVKANNFSIQKLTNCYRSNQSIVDACNKLIKGKAQIIGLNKTSFAPNCIAIEYDQYSDLDRIVQRFTLLLNEMSLDLKSSRILARGKVVLGQISMPNKLEDENNNQRLARSILTWCTGLKTKVELEKVLNLTGKVLSTTAYEARANPQQYYCPEGIAPIAWRHFLFAFIESVNELYPFEENGTAITWSQWGANLKRNLGSKWFLLPEGKGEWEQTKTKFRSPAGLANTFVNDYFSKKKTVSEINATTIHDVKGETFDAVLIISSETRAGGKGGHVQDWVEPQPGKDEHRRFAYVAFSRPKHLLIVAVPKTRDGEHVKRLIPLGFQYENWNPTSLELF